MFLFKSFKVSGLHSYKAEILRGGRRRRITSCLLEGTTHALAEQWDIAVLLYSPIEDLKTTN
jgi:hypothetical protein